MTEENHCEKVFKAFLAEQHEKFGIDLDDKILCELLYSAFLSGCIYTSERSLNKSKP